MVLVPADKNHRPAGRPNRKEYPIPAMELLLEATIKLIAESGPTDVSARQVCDFTGVKYASVNHNFGSWNGLIAHAASIVYVNYVSGLGEAVNRAPRNPEERFRAYVFEQLDWARRMPGWGAVFNYPISSRKASQILQRDFGHITQPHFELNVARLAQLIVDIREGTVSTFDFDVTNYPRAELLADKIAIARSTMAGWTTLGMMVWVGRGPTLQTQTPEILERQESIFLFTIDETIKAIREDKGRKL
jgi:AcrR family transcriptional regulator